MHLIFPMEMPVIPGLEFESELPWPALGRVYRAVWDGRLSTFAGSTSAIANPLSAQARRRDVVVQVLSGSLTANEEFRRRFRQLGPHVTSELHRNLVRVVEAGETEAHLFVIYRLAGPIEPLSERVERADFLSPEVVRMMALELAAGLDAMHRAGRIHGDVGPENVLFIPGAIQLADLGLVHLRPLGVQPRFLLGFLAPEQAVGDPRADDRTDIFRLGATLYFALTGLAPFAAESFDAMCFRVLEETSVEWPAVPRVPGAYKRIVERCMVKDPALRYPTVVALKHDLETLSPVGAVSSGRLRRTWGTTRTTREILQAAIEAEGDQLSPLRRVATWIVLAAAVTAAATVIAWFLGHI